MISGSPDKTIRRWDLETGKEIEEMRDVCEQKVRAVGVSRDGRWVVTACGDWFTHTPGELKVCEVETGTVRIFEGHSRSITCIDISADSTLLCWSIGEYLPGERSSILAKLEEARGHGRTGVGE